jgi:type I restriction enzyme S subunit
MEEKVGWTNAKVGEIADLLRGITYKKEQASKNLIEGYKPIIRANNINDSLNFQDLVYVPMSLIKEEQLVKKGDIIFAMSSGSKHLVGKSVQAKNDFQGSCGAFCALLRLSDNISKEFLAYIFQGMEFRKLISKISKGTNINNLKREHILDYNLPLPPLPEQRAIVSKIEQLFSDLDNGIANLRLAQEQLKVYRQAVLKKAFEGELTRKWREQQTDLPDARDLLEQIRIEREEAAKASDKKVKPVKPLTEDEIAELPGLPKGWGWVKLEEIGYWTGGGTPSKQNLSFWDNGDVLWVSPKDMKTKLIMDTEDRITKNSIENSSAKWIKKDSILFVVRSGIIRRVLQIALAGKDLTTNQDLQSLTLFWGNKDYVYWYCQANEQTIRDKCAKDGTTVDSIETQRFKLYPIAICSLPEQHAIVEEIETRLSVCDKMAQDIEEALEKAEALRQSILKKAFEGKLLNERELAEVRMAEDWEPAEVLLERIRAERVGNGKK